jgi:hypothetical protein
MDEQERQQQQFKRAVEQRNSEAREQAQASAAEAENASLDSHEREQGDRPADEVLRPRPGDGRQVEPVS